jgi:hypothetical protein
LDKFLFQIITLCFIQAIIYAKCHKSIYPELFFFFVDIGISFITHNWSFKALGKTKVIVSVSTQPQNY